MKAGGAPFERRSSMSLLRVAVLRASTAANVPAPRDELIHLGYFRCTRGALPQLGQGTRVRNSAHQVIVPGYPGRVCRSSLSAFRLARIEHYSHARQERARNSAACTSSHTRHRIRTHKRCARKRRKELASRKLRKRTSSCVRPSTRKKPTSRVLASRSCSLMTRITPVSSCSFCMSPIHVL